MGSNPLHGTLYGYVVSEPKGWAEMDMATVLGRPLLGMLGLHGFCLPEHQAHHDLLARP